MCSPNVHYDQHASPSPFDNNPFVSASSSYNRPGPSSLSRKPSRQYHNLRYQSNGGAADEGRSHLEHSPSRIGPGSATLHHTITHSSSVLSLAVDEQHGLVFSGSQSECIFVWDLRTYQQRTRLAGHTGSVLALELAPEKNWLFSSSGDNTVRIWDTKTLQPLYVVHPAEDNVGDIFALKWCRELETLYLGCQNTSIQWVCLAGIRSSASSLSAVQASLLRGSDSPTVATPSAFPISRPHKFFDSIPVALKRSANVEVGGTSAPGAKSGKAGISSPNIPAGLTLPSGEPLLKEALRGRSDPSDSSSTEARTSDSTDQVLYGAARKLGGISLSASGSSEGHGDGSGDPNHTRGAPGSALGAAVETLVVPPFCSVPSAHFGYIYTFTLLTLEGDDPYRTVLASGSGDETVKLWHATPEGLVHLATLENPNADGNAVLALASWKSTLFAGLQGGNIEVWDLETCTLVRTLRAHTDDVLALEACSFDGCLFSASADGRIRRWDRSFRCTDEWVAHDAIILSLAAIRTPPQLSSAGRSQRHRRMVQLVTGSSDDLIKIWNLPSPGEGAEALASGYRAGEEELLLTDSRAPALVSPTLAAHSSISEPSTLLSSLAQFVRYKSVSSVEENREDCRQAAHYLKACLTGLGAEAKILPNVPGRNPLVLGTFKANGPRSRSANRSRRASEKGGGGSGGGESGQTSEAPATPPATSTTTAATRCLFYGHYDCIAAEGQWDSDPFTMDGRDGYLYGRGVSDNKGPILAAACAASQLLTLRRLDVDVVFLIEGEEETGSFGFTEAVRNYKREIGEIDVILLSNSYWLGEDTPCLTVGLRGVVRATIEISGDEPDVHSGVEGGAVREPMIDMVKVLSSLTDGDHVTIPGFYDAVRPLCKAETAQYESIAQLKRQSSSPPTATSVSESARSLMAKWRYPSLSVHHIKVSGPGNSTVIPAKVSATVSLRLVPDQSLDAIGTALQTHVQRTFAALASSAATGTGTRVAVQVDHRADWWLGHEDSRYFLDLQRAVRQEWALDASHPGPISIREGGSIPAIAILEKELRAQAVHLPMGQSSDRAHLPNERIRLVNLQKGLNVVARFLLAIGGEGRTGT